MAEKVENLTTEGRVLNVGKRKKKKKTRKRMVCEIKEERRQLQEESVLKVRNNIISRVVLRIDKKETGKRGFGA